MGKRVIMFNWDYWNAQLEGYKNLNKKLNNLEADVIFLNY